MKFIKTIETLYERATRKGQATLNGRMNYYGYVSELQEKYAIEIEDGVLRMRHWGTETIKIDLKTKKIIEYYGESVSDRDSLNTILELTGIDGHFKYFPSKGEFVYEN